MAKNGFENINLKFTNFETILQFRIWHISQVLPILVANKLFSRFVCELLGVFM